MSNAPESRAAQTIREAMETGRPLVYIRSSEEQRIARILADISRRSGDVPLWTWSLTEGLRRAGRPAEPGTQDRLAPVRGGRHPTPEEEEGHER